MKQRDTSKNELKYTIYSLCDPRTQEVRYVGMSNNVIQRFGQHLSSPNDGGNEAKGAWILELQHAELMPVLQIVESGLSRESAIKREQYWMTFYLDGGSPLTNAIVPVNKSCKGRNKGVVPSQAEQEISQLLEKHGWYLSMIWRNNQRFAYAKCREGKKVLTRYLIANWS